MIYARLLLGVLCVLASFFAWGNAVEAGKHLDVVADSARQPLAIVGLGWKTLCLAFAYLAFRSFGGTL